VIETSNELSGFIDPDDYEEFLKHDLPHRILLKLNQEFQIIAEQARLRLLTIVQEESLETLRCYVRQKGLGSAQVDTGRTSKEQDAEMGQNSAAPLDFLETGYDASISAFLNMPSNTDLPGFCWDFGRDKDRTDSAYESNEMLGGIDGRTEDDIEVSFEEAPC